MKTPSFKCLLSLFTLALSIAAWADKTWTGNSNETTKYWNDSANWDGNSGRYLINSSATINFSELTEIPTGLGDAPVLRIFGGSKDSPVIFTTGSTDDRNSGLTFVSGAGNSAIGSGVGNNTSADGYLTIKGGYYKIGANDLVIGGHEGENGVLTLEYGKIETHYWLVMGGYANGSTSEFNIKGGAVQVGAGNGRLVVGQYSGSMATVNQEGGEVVSKQDEAALEIACNNATGTYNISGGSYTGNGNAWLGNGNGSKAYVNVSGSGNMSLTGDFILGYASSSYGELNLNGGTLTVASLKRGSGKGKIVFNGGTLKPQGENTAFMPANEDFDVQIAEGGLIIDTEYDITISAKIYGSGPITKKGSGIVTFSGDAIYYTGTVTTELGAGDVKFASGAWRGTTADQSGNYLVSEPTNWHQGQVPSGIAFFGGAESAGKTVTFGANLNLSGDVDVISWSSGNNNYYADEDGWCTWKATDPSYGVKQTAGALLIGQGESGTGRLAISSGTHNFSGKIRVGDWKGTGYLKVDGGYVESADEVYIAGDSAHSTGKVYVNGGALVNRNWFCVGRAGDCDAYLEVNGGAVSNLVNNLTIGTCGNSSSKAEMLVKKGEVYTAGNLYVGEWDSATVTVQGGDVIVKGNVVFGTEGNFGSDETATLNIEGGTITAKQFNKGKGSGTATLNLKGGTIKAADDADSYIIYVSDSRSLSVALAEGTTSTIDVNGQDQHINVPLSGTGTLRVTGGGSLELRRVPSNNISVVLDDGVVLKVPKDTAFSSLVLGKNAHVVYIVTSYTDGTEFDAGEISNATLPDGESDLLSHISIRTGERTSNSVRMDGTTLKANITAAGGAVTTTWIGKKSGDWNDANNWTAGVPNSTTDTAYFPYDARITTLNINAFKISICDGCTVKFHGSTKWPKLRVASTEGGTINLSCQGLGPIEGLVDADDNPIGADIRSNIEIDPTINGDNQDCWLEGNSADVPLNIYGTIDATKCVFRINQHVNLYGTLLSGKTSNTTDNNRFKDSVVKEGGVIKTVNGGLVRFLNSSTVQSGAKLISDSGTINIADNSTIAAGAEVVANGGTIELGGSGITIEPGAKLVADAGTLNIPDGLSVPAGATIGGTADGTVNFKGGATVSGNLIGSPKLSIASATKDIHLAGNNESFSGVVNNTKHDQVIYFDAATAGSPLATWNIYGDARATFTEGTIKFGALNYYKSTWCVFYFPDSCNIKVEIGENNQDCSFSAAGDCRFGKNSYNNQTPDVTVVKKGSGNMDFGMDNVKYLEIAGGTVSFTTSHRPDSTISFKGGTLVFKSDDSTTDCSGQFAQDNTGDISIDTVGHNITFATALKTTGKLVKSGTGVLTLSAAPTCEDIVVNGGSVCFDLSSSLSGASSTVTQGGATVVNAPSGNLILGANTYGSGVLKKTGLGVLTLPSDVDIAGLTVEEGVVIVPAGSANLGAVTVGEKGVLAFDVPATENIVVGTSVNLAEATSLSVPSGESTGDCIFTIGPDFESSIALDGNVVKATPTTAATGKTRQITSWIQGTTDNQYVDQGASWSNGGPNGAQASSGSDDRRDIVVYCEDAKTFLYNTNVPHFGTLVLRNNAVVEFANGNGTPTLTNDRIVGSGCIYANNIYLTAISAVSSNISIQLGDGVVTTVPAGTAFSSVSFGEESQLVYVVGADDYEYGTEFTLGSIAQSTLPQEESDLLLHVFLTTGSRLASQIALGDQSGEIKATIGATEISTPVRTAWIGGRSTDWGTTSNWSAGVPTSYDDAYFMRDVEIKRNSDLEMGGITLANGASLYFNRSDKDPETRLSFVNGTGTLKIMHGGLRPQEKCDLEIASGVTIKYMPYTTDSWMKASTSNTDGYGIIVHGNIDASEAQFISYGGLKQVEGEFIIGTDKDNIIEGTSVTFKGTVNISEGARLTLKKQCVFDTTAVLNGRGSLNLTTVDGKTDFKGDNTAFAGTINASGKHVPRLHNIKSGSDLATWNINTDIYYVGTEGGLLKFGALNLTKGDWNYFYISKNAEGLVVEAGHLGNEMSWGNGYCFGTYDTSNGTASTTESTEVALRKVGTGVLNTYAAHYRKLELNDGVVAFKNNEGPGSTFQFNGGTARFDYEYSWDPSSRFDLTESSGPIDVDTADNCFTWTTAITGQNSIIKRGTGTLALTGAHTYKGKTDVKGGILIMPYRDFGSQEVAVASGAELHLDMSNATITSGTTFMSSNIDQATASAISLTGKNYDFTLNRDETTGHVSYTVAEATGPNKWVGGAIGQWKTASNWKYGVPTADQTVEIDADVTATYSDNYGSGNLEAGELLLSNNATLTIKAPNQGNYNRLLTDSVQGTGMIVLNRAGFGSLTKAMTVPSTVSFKVTNDGTNDSWLECYNGTLTIEGSLTISNYLITYGNIDLKGDVTIESNGKFAPNNTTTLSGNGKFTNGGTLYWRGSMSYFAGTVELNNNASYFFEKCAGSEKSVWNVNSDLHFESNDSNNRQVPEIFYLGKINISAQARFYLPYTATMDLYIGEGKMDVVHFGDSDWTVANKVSGLTVHKVGEGTLETSVYGCPNWVVESGTLVFKVLTGTWHTVNSDDGTFFNYGNREIDSVIVKKDAVLSGALSDKMTLSSLTLDPGAIVKQTVTATEHAAVVDETTQEVTTPAYTSYSCPTLTVKGNVIVDGVEFAVDWGNLSPVTSSDKASLTLLTATGTVTGKPVAAGGSNGWKPVVVDKSVVMKLAAGFMLMAF